MARSWSCGILLCTLSISFLAHRVHATTLNGDFKFNFTNTANSVSVSTDIEHTWNDIIFSWKHTTFRLIVATIVLANVVFTISKLFELFAHRASIKHQSTTVLIVIFCESVASLSMFGFLVFSWWLPYWAICLLLNWSVSWSIAASAGLLNALTWTSLLLEESCQWTQQTLFKLFCMYSVGVVAVDTAYSIATSLFGRSIIVVAMLSGYIVLLLLHTSLAHFCYYRLADALQSQCMLVNAAAACLCVSGAPMPTKSNQNPATSDIMNNLEVNRPQSVSNGPKCKNFDKNTRDFFFRMRLNVYILALLTISMCTNLALLLFNSFIWVSYSGLVSLCILAALGILHISSVKVKGSLTRSVPNRIPFQSIY